MAFYTKFADYYETIFPFKQTTFDFIKSYATKDMTSVLDVGCGTGQYAAAFANSGFQATGIDLDAAMIEYAKTHYPAPHFCTMNMMDIESLHQKFDVIFCIGNTLAHLSEIELDAFLRTVHTMLNSGGTWIFQVRNWDFVLQQKEYEFQKVQAHEGRVLFTRSYKEITANSLSFNTRLTDGENLIFKDRVKMTPQTAQHYRDQHENLGFQCLGVFSDFKRSTFHPDRDSALIYVFTV